MAKKKQSGGNAAAQTPATGNSSYQFLWAPALVALIAFILYFPASGNSFLDWDDQMYVTENPMLLLKDKPGAPSVWTTPIALNYHPLTMKTIEWDAARGGMKKNGTFEPGPFISTNILLHTLNSVLVFFLAWLLTGRNMFASLFSGLLFAVHPMHVESVAWISERKDVLYTFFFLLSLLTWLHFSQARKPGWYVASLLLFILACLSKAMAVSLVPVLFLLDWWNGRSLRSAGVWMEKLPFIAAAVLFGLMAMDVQAGGNFHGWLSNVEGAKDAIASTFSLTQRAQFAGYGMIQYLIRFFAPFGLSPFYPYPDQSLLGGGLPASFAAYSAVFLAVAGVAVWSLKKSMLGLWSLAFYFFTVILVSQIISVGVVVMADRYTYVPYIGLGIGLSYGIWQLSSRSAGARTAAWAGMTLFCLFLAVRTASQRGIWKDTETLWTAALEQFPGDGQILTNLGNYYGKMNNLDKAASCFEEALKYGVKNAKVYEGLGNVYGFRGQPQKAAEMFSEAIKLDPRVGNYYYNRGTAYALFDPKLAIRDLDKAIELVPQIRQGTVYGRRAYCYMQLKQYEAAIRDYDRAISMKESRPDLVHDRGVAKFQLGDKAGALADFRLALSMNPNFEPAKRSLSQMGGGQ
jgi:tetratricopeptide (TPR) repeat protein